MNKIYKLIMEKLVVIHKNEWAKFLCIASMIFLIIYIYAVLRISRDALVVSHLGAEAISAIKVWVVLPVSLVFISLYIKLFDSFVRSRLFHCMSWFFISYYIVFALFLYPHGAELSISISDAVIIRLPALKYLFKIISSWHYCMFYVFSELWIVAMLSISFWQIANHITTIEEAKRFYPLLGIAAQLGLTAASVSSKFFVGVGTDWQPTLNNVTISVVVAGLALSLSLIALGKVIGAETLNLTKDQLRIKDKMNFRKSLKYIVSSKPILLVTSLLLCYNISFYLVEDIWKKAVEVFFAGDANHIHYFMSGIYIYVSILSIACAFLSILILRVCKWKTVALITPLTVLTLGGMFFLFMLLRDKSAVLTMKTSALAIVVYLGAIQNIFSRSTKYTLFDPAKEMVYIPLNNKLKTKGKAAAETIGMKFGKGGGAFINQLLLTLFPSLTLLDLSPIISVIFLVVLLWWLFATLSLSRNLVAIER